MMPRTTIDLDSSVLQQIKSIARASGRTIGEVASELLAAALHESPRGGSKLVWRTRRMRSRVDLEDKDAIYRVLDRR